MQTCVPEDGTKEKSLASRVIDFVRFPLIVLVVTIHFPGSEFVPGGTFQNFPVADFFRSLISGIAQVAVPLFFFISGYLFFLNASHFSRETYFKKLKKRFWTLFIPIATWGTILFSIEFVAWEFGIEICRNNWFDDYSAQKFIHDLLVRGVLATASVQFWFIRGLIIACLLSPLWFFLLKKLKVLPLILFGLWYCFFPFPTGISEWILPLGPGVVFFFCFGAYFSIHEIDFTKVFSKIRVPLFVIYPIFLVGNTMLRLFDFAELYDKTKNIEVVIGVATAVALVSLFLGKHPSTTLPKTLRDATFFVFAGHTSALFLVHAICRSAHGIFPCETNLGIIVAFLGAITFAVLACTFLSILVRKFAPWSIKFLTGGR